MLNFEKRSRNLEMRHKLEEEYFKDAGIPTRRISANQINRSVLNNLRRLIYHAHDQHTLDQDSVNAIEARIRAIVDKEGIVLEKIAPICEQHGCSRQEFHTILWQGIWHRRIRVNLYEPLLINQPMQRERRDVLSHYGDWFRR